MFTSRPLRMLAPLALALLCGCARELPLQPASGPDSQSGSTASVSAPGGLVAGGDGAVVPGEYLVMLRAVPAQAGAARINRQVDELSRRFAVAPRNTYRTVLAGFSARMSREQAARMARDPAVASIEPNRFVRAYAQSVPAGITLVKAPSAQARGVRGAGVKVGVIDTGIDYTHPDLAASYAGGVDFVNHDNDPMDDNGHGTHVSGTIAATDNTEGVIGVAPAARLYGIKVLGADGSGTFADVIAGIDWAAAYGMKVVNLSLGASVGATALQAAVDNATQAGVVVCAAAGNSGGKVGYPAAYPSCICVSAVDNNKQIASFSCRGSEVDVTAPGVGVLSTWPHGGYATLQGTSMATPHVTGVAALVWATGQWSQASQVRERVVATCTDIGAAGVDPLYGKGLINADLATVLPPNRLPVARAGGPYAAIVNTSVAFSSAGASDPDGRLVAWAWDFGDGATSTEANPSHAYARVASFTARLTVTDDRGGRASGTASVRIKPVPPDTVTIYRCDYTKSTKMLVVTASSTNGAASLSVEGQGAMSFDPNSRRWGLSRMLDRKPTRVTVVSTRKGSASKSVTGL